MSKAALIRIAVALAVALVAWGALALVHGPVSDRPASLALPRIDTARVDTILLAKGRDTAVLARTSARPAWTANGYRADSGAVASLLGGLADTVRQTELVSEGRIVVAGALADRGRLAEAIALLQQSPPPRQKVQLRHLRECYVLADLYERSGDVARARELFRFVSAYFTFSLHDAWPSPLGSAPRIHAGCTSVTTKDIGNCHA